MKLFSIDHLTRLCLCFFIVFEFVDAAFDIFSKLDQVKERVLAEIKYKTGMHFFKPMKHSNRVRLFENIICTRFMSLHRNGLRRIDD